MREIQDPNRIGDWCQIYSGKPFWPLDPKPEEIDINDIAHALSLLCRWGGHCIRFLSVAEHSVHIARSVSPENALWALLHDATEAFLVDVPRPIKRQLPTYVEAEHKIEQAVKTRFGLYGDMPKEVKDADNAMLFTERYQNLKKSVREWGWGDDIEPLNVALQYWEPSRAKEEFLKTFEEVRFYDR